MQLFGHFYQYGEFEVGRIEQHRLTLFPLSSVVLQPSTSASPNKFFSCTPLSGHTLGY